MTRTLAPVEIGSATAEDAADAGDPGEQRVALQWARLPRRWRRGDRAIVRTTEVALFAIGVLFTLMITLEVISRFVFSFSISFVNASARMLLVWFFLLGAGVALRRGAHVGFELLVAALGARARRVLVLAGLAMTALFSLEMIWSGLWSIGPALHQTEAGLDVSVVWVVSALPVGFALLVYHALVLIYLELRDGDGSGEGRVGETTP